MIHVCGGEVGGGGGGTLAVSILVVLMVDVTTKFSCPKISFMIK